MKPPVLTAIRSLLADRGVEFRELHHAPTRTSQQAADARGEPIEIAKERVIAASGSSADRLAGSMRGRSAGILGPNASASPLPMSCWS